MTAHDELFHTFHGLVALSVSRHVTSEGDEDVSEYLTRLLMHFIHADRLFALRDGEGRRVVSVADMVAEGDIRANADSFEREREVHKHIGDFILFWHGISPEYLSRLRLVTGRDLLCAYPWQGRESYRVVSQFDAPPHEDEARTFAKLSDGFDDYAWCLGDVGRKLLAPSAGRA